MTDSEHSTPSRTRRSSLLGDRTGEVSPLELFFDLVFVFAVSQLSEHLVDDMTWRGAGQTAVLLVAVFSIWSFTSWGVSFPQGGRFESQSVLVVLFLALFANAAIPRAFTESGWMFIVPFLVCLLGQTVFALTTAEATWLRVHYRAMLIWTVVEAGCWLTGTIVDPGSRLGWWAVAALLNVVGAWAGHPLPGRRFRSQEVRFDPARMVERSRLFLLIALGECVLEVGIAIAGSPITVQAYFTAAFGLVSTVMLWFLYFRSSDRVVDQSAGSAPNSLRVARIAVNSQLVVLAALIAVAVGTETAVEHPLQPTEIAVAVTLHAGPLLYLAAQSWYLHALSGSWSVSRLVGVVVLLVTLPITALTVPLAGVVLITVILAGVVLGAGAVTRPHTTLQKEHTA